MSDALTGYSTIADVLRAGQAAGSRVAKTSDVAIQELPNLRDAHSRALHSCRIFAHGDIDFRTPRPPGFAHARASFASHMETPRTAHPKT